jgi:hypothetical protein
VEKTLALQNKSVSEIKRFAFWVFLLGMGMFLAILVNRAAVDVPFQDELAFESIYSALANRTLPSFSGLLSAHNGHPYFLLKIIAAATLMIGMPWSALMYAQIPLLLIASGIATRKSSIHSKCGILAMLAIVLVLVSPRQWENLYWAMQISVALALVVGLGAFYCVNLYGNERKLGWLMLGLFLALISCLNTGMGFAAFLITILVLFILRPSRFHLVFITITLFVGTGLYVAAAMFAEHGGVGKGFPSPALFVKHALLMLANAVAFYDPNNKFIGLAIGSAVMCLLLYCGRLAIRNYTDSVFEICCLLWGLGLVVIVTHSRVTMGIWQPDAPRYVPLVAPLIVGFSLVLQRLGKRWILVLLVAGLTLGYIQSAISEWKITPYRKDHMDRSLQNLCNGVIDRPDLATLSQVKDIQKVFCRQDQHNLRDL